MQDQFCVACGAPRVEGAAFCGACGTRFAVSASPVVEADVATKTTVVQQIAGTQWATPRPPTQLGPRASFVVKYLRIAATAAAVWWGIGFVYTVWETPSRLLGPRAILVFGVTGFVVGPYLAGRWNGVRGWRQWVATVIISILSIVASGLLVATVSGRIPVGEAAGSFRRIIA